MNSRYIWDSIDTDQAPTIRQIGGKCWQLAKISSFSLIVPEWVCVKTEALEDFLGENGITPPSLVSDLTEAQTVREQIIGAPLPKQIRDDIQSVARRLFQNSRSGALVIRSSATVEDTQVTTFAGLFDTFCGIIDFDALLSRVKECWASLWSSEASRYLITRNLTDQLSMAVIIQEFIPATVSGVMFTVNPVNSRMDELTVEASWGLGEPIVGGRITPDHFIVNRSSCESEVRLASFRRGSKRKALIWNTTKKQIEELFIPLEQQKILSISEDEVLDLAEIGLFLESKLGYPQDIEWSIYDSQIFLLQARPITTLRLPQS